MSLLSNPRPVVVVVGVGAVGGFYGAKLVRAGEAEVHLLLRGDFDAVRRDGLRVRSVDGDFTLLPDQLRVHRDAGEVPKADLVLVTLKATGNAALDSLVRPLLKDDTALLTLQNGLGNEDELARLFGPERVVGGMAFACINRVAPGVIHHLDHGFLKIGEHVMPGQPAPGETPRVRRAADLFRNAGIRCDVLDDLRQGRWEKLLWNVAFNGFGAALDLTTDLLLATAAGRDLALRVMREVEAVAAAEGVSLPADIVPRQITHTASMGAYQSSMQIDRRQGRPLETEAILGEPLRRAEALGVECPVLRNLYDLVRAVDPGEPRNV